MTEYDGFVVGDTVINNFDHKEYTITDIQVASDDGIPTFYIAPKPDYFVSSGYHYTEVVSTFKLSPSIKASREFDKELEELLK
jgi:hypothetical protein